MGEAVVVAEALAVSGAEVAFDVVPGVPSGTAVPAYAGVPLGSAPWAPGSG